MILRIAKWSIAQTIESCQATSTRWLYTRHSPDKQRTIALQGWRKAHLRCRSTPTTMKRGLLWLCSIESWVSSYWDNVSYTERYCQVRDVQQLPYKCCPAFFRLSMDRMTAQSSARALRREIHNVSSRSYQFIWGPGREVEVRPILVRPFPVYIGPGREDSSHFAPSRSGGYSIFTKRAGKESLASVRPFVVSVCKGRRGIYSWLCINACRGGEGREGATLYTFP